MSTSKNKIKILFILPNLSAGGAERVMSFVASNLNQQKFDCTLAITGSKENTAYEISNIKVVYFNKPRVRNAFFSLFQHIKNEKYKVVLSTIYHVNTVASVYAMLLRKVIFIGRETLVNNSNDSSKKNIPSFSMVMQKRFLDIMICQSNDMYNLMLNRNGFKKEKLVVINNPITQDFILKTPFEKKVPHFITVGRLAKQKGYERILKGLKELDFPYHYKIIGSGPEESRIMKLAQDLGLEKNISHIPYSSEVAKHLSESDYFISGSYYEGFPNAFIESCAVGTPIVAFEAPGGINEIIIENTNGFIVRTEAELTSCLQRAVDIKWNIQAVRESVTNRYSKEIIISKYEQLIINSSNTGSLKMK